MPITPMHNEYQFQLNKLNDQLQRDASEKDKPAIINITDIISKRKSI